MFDETIAQCDLADRVQDGITSSPEMCDFNPEALLCTPLSNTSTCLNSDQITTLNKLDADWRTDKTELIFPGSNLEAESIFSLTTQTENGDYEPFGFSVTYVKNFVRNDKN